jgi:hypothetical protein
VKREAHMDNLYESYRINLTIVATLICFSSLFAGPKRFSEKFDSKDLFRLSAEYGPSSKTRTVDSLDCELVGGWFRGPSFAICVVDTIAYLGGFNYMKILNVKDSTNPVLLGEIRFPSGIAHDIVVKDTLAYMADLLEGFRIIDVSDPSTPTEIGFCETPGWVLNLWVQDTFAYIVDYGFLGNQNFALHIINVSDPFNPIIVSSYSDLWYPHDVWVEDTIAYVAGSALYIINVSNPSSPDSISVFSDTRFFYDVYVRDTLAYVAGVVDNDSLFISIINVVDPSLPVEVGSYYLNLDFGDDIYEIRNIWVQDSLAYLAVGSWTAEPDSCGLYIVDVSDPASMNEVGNYLTGRGRTQDVCVKDKFAYISCYADFYDDPEGLLIIDISVPSLPNVLGEYDTGLQIRNVWIKDSFAYVANRGRGLNIINVSDPSSPFEIGFCDSPVYPEEVFVKDTFAYVTDQEYGLRIINIANPSSPSEVGICDTTGHVLGTFVQDTLAYVADGDSGLYIINVSDPSSPTEIGSYNIPLGANDVWVRDTLAYLAADSLYIIDVSNPSFPVDIGALPGGFEKIFIKDTLAYLIDGSLHIIDISEPALPIEVGSYNLPGSGWCGDVWVKDNLAYVANDTCGLRIIDVSNPSSPTEVGFYNTFPYYGGYPLAFDVYVQDSLIYVAYGRGGLYIFKYTGPYGGIEELTTERDKFNISSISNTIEINYSVVSNEEEVKIEIFNVLGQKVGCPVDGVQTRGSYTLNWSGKTGIYFVRMEMGGEVYKEKALLLR